MRTLSLIHNNVVVNTVAVPDGWNGRKGEWPVPLGHDYVLDDNTAVIGARRRNGVFERDQPVAVPAPPSQVDRLLAILIDKAVIEEQEAVTIKGEAIVRARR